MKKLMKRLSAGCWLLAVSGWLLGAGLAFGEPVAIDVDALGEVSFERDGYRFDSETRLVTLLEDRQFVLTGSSSDVGVYVTENVKSVMLNGLKLEHAKGVGAPIRLENQEGTEVVFTLANANVLVAPPHCAALEVPCNAKLTITADDDMAELTAVGGRKKGRRDAELPEEDEDEGDPENRIEGGAGIGTGAPRADCGTIIIRGGKITATGGERAAGIGGGDAGGCAGNVEISGGMVTATGGWGAAGIGSGYGQWYDPSRDGKIVISGGRVTALGGAGGAGVGGGGYWESVSYWQGPEVQIRGGTVNAEGGEGITDSRRSKLAWPWDFGAGSNPGTPPKVVITGGTVWAKNSDRGFNLQPCSNPEFAWAPVYPVYVRLGSSAADAKVEVVGLPSGFGVNDLYANKAGDLCFYSNWKSVTFAVRWMDAGGTYVTKRFWAKVTKYGTTAVPLSVDGLFVNGVAVNLFASGPGWRRVSLDNYSNYSIHLDGSVERYVLSGMASNAVVNVENLDSTKVLELKDLCLQFGGHILYSPSILFANACRGKKIRLELNGSSYLQGHINAITLCDGLFCEIDAAAGATNAVLVTDVRDYFNQYPDEKHNTATGAICGEADGALSLPKGTIALRGGVLYAEGGGADYWSGKILYPCAGLHARTNIVSGGTLCVLAGKVGLGRNPPSPSLRASEANIFTGGSIFAGDGTMSTEAAIRVAPTNGAGKAVHRVTVPVSGGTGDDRRVKISGIPDYGCKDIVALDGKAYLYLPDGDYVFTVNGRFVRATVNGADTEATDKLGFTVNGTDVMAGPGEGWAYNEDDGILSISGKGPYVLSGAAMFDEVQVNVAGFQNPTVVLSNAVIFTEGRPALNVASGATLALAAGQVMKAGDAPETMRYTADWTRKTSILVGPGATVTVKDGIPHVTDAVVSNRTGTVSWTAVEGGKAYRVLLGDDIFVGYTVEKGYFPRAENPLRYAAIGGDVTVDANAIPTAADLPYRAWNPTTRRMEDRTCSGYEVVTANTATFENGKWYAVTNTVNRGMITVNGAAHLILCDGARLTANGGKNQAGIAVVSGNSLAIYGQALGTGELVAQGGDRSAGIGGRNRLNTSCGAVTIDGGRVTARGGFRAAGIGSGNKGAGGTVTINGGQVWAQGDQDSADIGGGYRGGGGVVTINGGTVTAAGASTSIGGGKKRRRNCRLTIDGGSVKANIAQGLAKNSTPTNVYCVTAKCPFASASAADRPLVLEGLGNYGTNDIYVVEEKVCLWLPNGTYRFTLSDGSTTHRYFAVVKGRDITVEPLGPIGFFVNGVDIGARAGMGWAYGDDKVLSLNGNGTYVLSGLATNDEVQIAMAADDVTAVLSNAVVFTEGRPSLDIAQGAKLRMAGGASFLGTTNNAAAVSIAQGAELVVDLAPGANRLETMIGVFNYDAAAAVAGQGSAKVNGGTFFVWSDNRAIGVRQFAADASELMQAGDTPEEMRYTTEWTSKKCVLVGPSVSVTVKNGIPHASGFTVSNAVEAIAGEAIVGGTVYRVMIGDDVFVGYTLEEEYFSDAENPLVYASIEGDVTVDRTTIPTVKGILYRDWNAETQQMEDRLCVDYVGVTADTAAFEDGKWYVVTNTVLRHGTITVSGSAHLILCDDAKLTVTGTAGSAAIGLASDNELSIYGQRGCRGELLVSGGENGAGIGGGDRLSGGPVRIYGGIVTAQGGDCGAGIGGGMEGGAAVLSVRGGRISARGGAFAAGIGGGNGNAPGDVTVVISGGTVTAVGDENAEDIGYGSGGTGNENIRIYGGSVRARMPGGLPKDFSDSALYRVEVKCEGLKAGALNVEGLRGYGTNDVFAIDGRIYLWLPDGTHRFALSDGTSTHYYCAVIRGHDITVEPLGPNGFHVNGTDIAVGSGMGWTYGDNAVLSFNAGGRYVLSGRAADDAVQIKVGVADVELVLSNAVVFASGRPALYVEKDVSLLMAGGESCFAATNAPGGIPSPAMTVANQAALAIGLASGCDRREPSFCVFSYGLAAAINGTGSISVSNGTFAVWGDPQAAMVPIVCAADTLAMAAGDDPGTAKYVTSYGSEPYVLVAPGATVTVKDGIPHITGFTVSNAVGRIEGRAVAGGRAYRVMLGDDVFVGYTVEAGYTSRTANPLVYTDVEGDITVDENDFRFTENIPYRAWNETTRMMEDRECIDYAFVTADTVTFEDGKWYAVRGAVSCGTITASGAAHLILCDGAKLTVTGGVNEAGLAVTNGNALAIYGQSLGTGELVAKGYGMAAGIGSSSGAKGGAVTVNGGIVTATGGKCAAGVGGGNAGDGGIITVNGGTVMAMGDGKLPGGYAAVEYIESTPDGGQYINTEYTPNASTKVVCRLLDKGTDSHRQFGAVFGTREEYSWKKCMHLWLRHFNENRPSYGRAGTESWSEKSTFPFGEITTVTCQGPTCSWVNDAGTKEKGITLTTGYDVNQENGLAPLTIFAINSTTVEGGCNPLEFWSFRLYSFRIYEGEKLVRDFVPCVSGAGAAGLYDTVGRKFYGNAGNEQFAHGEVTIADVADIGGGCAGADATVTFNGGSVKAETVRSAPTNGTGAPVYCVKTKCEGIRDQGSGIRVEGLEGYGTDGVRPIDGWVYLWLPNGTHRFTLSDGQATFRYCAVVNGGDVTVEPLALIGFFVNGEDIGENGIGDGWYYQERVLALGGAKAYVLSGEATNNEVQVRAAANGATAVLSNAFVFTEGRPAVEVVQGAALAIGAGQVMLAGETPETLWYATTCGVARCVRVVPGATVMAKADIPHVSNVVVSNRTGRIPGDSVSGGTVYRALLGDDVFVGYTVEAGYVSDAENPLRYLPIEGDVMVDKELEGRIWKPTGVTVDGKDIGCREWTADGSDCHFDTNSWTLSFNLSERFLLEGSNRTDRAISMFLATNGLSVAFTNLAIGSTAETVYPIGTGSDPTCWGFFTNTANAVVKVGEGVYAFDPADRMLPDLTSGRIAPNRWLVAPAGSFKARATVDGVTYRFRTLGEALAVAGRGGEIELEADISGERLSIPSDAFFTLDGNGHMITPLAAGDSAALVTVASNCFVCALNVVFDGNGASNALASVESFGALALENCVVRGFRVPEGALIAVDSSKGSSAPAVALSGLVTSNNVARGGVGAVAGTSILSADALADAVVLAEGAEIAFTNVAPTARIVLDPINAANRIGATLVRAITGGVALDPAKVGISAPDYVAVGDGKGGIVLDYAANNYVARIGGTAYLSLSAAFAAANNGSTIEAIALTNRAQRTCRDTVSASGICTVGKDRRVGLGSVLCEVDGSGHLSPIPASGVRTTVDWSAPGAKLVIDKDAVLAPGNVAFRGPLTLDGEGLLDLAAYAGTITVRPQRKGRIAVNATGKLQLAGGMAGELYVNSSGEAFYRVGSFTAEFKETGNGVGMIVIDDYGENVTIQVSNPVMDGSFTYRYKSAVTGENRDLTFGVLYLDTSCDTFALPPETSGANPKYRAKGDADKPLTTIELPNDIQVGAGGTITLKNYNSTFTISGIEPITKEELEKRWEEILRRFFDDEKEGKDWLEFLKYLPEDLRDQLLDILDAAFMAALEVLDKSWAEILGTVRKVLATLKGVASVTRRLVCSLYVNEGDKDDDYYLAFNAEQAFNRAIEEDLTVHYTRDALTPAYVVDDGSVLTIDLKGAVNVDASSIACWAKLPGHAKKFDEIFLQNLINKVVQKVAAAIIKAGGYAAQIGMAKPHASAQDGQGPWLTVEDGATLEIKNLLSRDWMRKDVPIGPTGTILLIKDDGTLKIEDSLITNYNMQVGCAVEVEEGGSLKIGANVLIRDNVKNVCVSSSESITVEDGTSQIGISGLTEDGQAFAMTNGEELDWNSIFLNDRYPGDTRYSAKADGDLVKWIYAVPTPGIPSFPRPGDEARTGGHAFDIRMITERDGAGNVTTFARIWGAPTNGVKGAWYYLKATEALGKEFGYLPDFKWQAAEDGPVTEMQKGPEGSCCDVPAPSTITNRFFRVGAQATVPVAQ